MAIDAVPPYAASLRWYGRWYGCVLDGMTDEEAVACANRESGVEGKDFARTRVRSAEGVAVLSVAVEGGSAGLRRRGAEKRAKVSLHGRWPHVHLGALEASYGRSPYYQHIMPGLRGILDQTMAGDSLGALNRRVHGLLAGFLPKDVAATTVGAETIMRRAQEIASGLDPELSLIDSLMQLGPETSLALLCYR